MEGTTFEPTWAIVDLFGHQRIAGMVSEQTIAGGAFVRVDVPDVGDDRGYTRFFGASAIYSISPVSEDIATRMARRVSGVPVAAYELPKLPSGSGEYDD